MKANYAKFQGIEVGGDGEKKQTINLRVHIFEGADESWLNYVCDCRAGKDVQDDYDIVSGAVADDDVYSWYGEKKSEGGSQHEYKYG